MKVSRKFPESFHPPIHQWKLRTMSFEKKTWCRYPVWSCPCIFNQQRYRYLSSSTPVHDKKCQKYFQSLSPILYVKQHLNYQKSKVKMRTNMFKRHRIGTIVQIPVNFCLRRSITTDTTPPTHQHLAEVSKQFLRSFHGFCVSPSFLIRQNFRSPISISIVHKLQKGK